MSKNKSSANRRRFSKGDGVLHAVYGPGHVWQGACWEPAARRWVCLVEFEGHASDTALRHQEVAEADLTSLPGTGLRKYGQGKAGCRVGSSRYGARLAERHSSGNGRTLVRRLNPLASHSSPLQRAAQVA